MLVILTAAVFGCAATETRDVLDPPGFWADHQVGLVLAEKVTLEVIRGSRMEVTPAAGTEAVYQARIEPGRLTAELKRSGSGLVYLGWVPALSLPEGAEQVTVIVTGYEIGGADGLYSQTWPEADAPRVIVRVRPGRAAYLGVLQRSLVMSGPQLPEGYREGDEIDPEAYGPPRVEVVLNPDPQGLAIETAVLDNPWLKERLLCPPPCRDAE